MAVIPEGWGQVNLLYTGTGYPEGAQVTFGIDNRSLDLPALTIGGLVLDAYVSAGLASPMANSSTLSGILVKLGPNDTGPSVVTSASVTGANADPASAAVSWLATKHTLFGGRRGRGRSYFPSVRESQVDGAGMIPPAIVTDWNTRLFNFHAELATESIPMVLLHSYPLIWTVVNNRPRSSPDTSAALPDPYELTGWTMSNEVATQRRRQRS